MKTLRNRYTVTRTSDLKITEEMRSLISRRTRPFLDSVGIDRPLTMLLQEVYLQGITDAVDAMEARNDRAKLEVAGG